MLIELFSSIGSIIGEVVRITGRVFSQVLFLFFDMHFLMEI